VSRGLGNVPPYTAFCSFIRFGFWNELRNLLDKYKVVMKRTHMDECECEMLKKFKNVQTQRIAVFQQRTL
jgi:hypothetical protein